MTQTIGFVLLIGWFGFWVWLWLTNPEGFRKVYAAMQGVIDKAAGAGADAVHRAVTAKKRPPPGGGAAIER